MTKTSPKKRTTKISYPWMSKRQSKKTIPPKAPEVTEAERLFEEVLKGKKFLNPKNPWSCRIRKTMTRILPMISSSVKTRANKKKLTRYC